MFNSYNLSDLPAEHPGLSINKNVFTLDRNTALRVNGSELPADAEFTGTGGYVEVDARTRRNLSVTFSGNVEFSIQGAGKLFVTGEAQGNDDVRWEGEVVVRDDAETYIAGDCNVTAKDNATVRINSHGVTAEAFGKASVISESCPVTAILHDRAYGHFTSYAECQVTMYDNSWGVLQAGLARAYDNSEIELFRNGRAEASQDAKVIISGKGRQQVQATDNVKVRYDSMVRLADLDITLSGRVTLSKQD